MKVLFGDVLNVSDSSDGNMLVLMSVLRVEVECNSVVAMSWFCVNKLFGPSSKLELVHGWSWCSSYKLSVSETIQPAARPVRSLEEQAILRYKAENGGTFQQARKAVFVEIHKTISMRTFASAVKSQLRTKPSALSKDDGRSAPSAPPKDKKAQKDSPAPSPQGAAEIEVPAKRRTEKSKRQEAPRETVNRFAPLAMDAENTITKSGGILHPQLPKGLHLSYGVRSLPLQTPIPLQIPPPAHGGETPRSFAFPIASLPLHPRSPGDGGGEGY
ncbi:hypothetical protein PoB_001498200 [Plakobranchus ocellatus]|uniref:Uncharacterized protein n=1 Tax=Plakobranchus ocellatus TaxID=259542 RepID=A0AAV3Z1V8_9GAST|nr:hypothetical protein PoB_001498200 [Plakobranchus ocellatus]